MEAPQINQGVRPTRWDWRDIVVLVCGIVALGVAAYLSWQALITGTTPPGCGEGQGCGEVLTSKYARFLGVPVSLLAVLAYVGLLGSWFTARRRDVGWASVLFFSVAIIASAVWFIFLQLTIVGAICTYCMADHTFGLIAAAVAMNAALGRTSGAPAKLVAPLVALVLVIVMAGVQHFSQPALEVTLLEGTVTLPMAEVPHVGPVDAERKVFVMFDYACPHCKEAHDVILQAQSERANLYVALLPVSIWPTCNDTMSDVPERFSESCELAELAMAVHQVDPEAFYEFDRWMFDWDGYTPRAAAEARAKAEQMVGAEALRAALESGEPRRMLERNVGIFQAAGADRVPVTLVGTNPTHRIFGKVTRYEPIEELFGRTEHAE